MATAIINSQMDAINESFSNISSDLTTIRPLLKNASIGAYPTDTASGAIASFTDGADGIPVKSLSVDLEPIQDLNGYDNPWPAGGGKNKFDASLLSDVSATLQNITVTLKANTTYTMSSTIPIQDGSTANLFFMLPSGGASSTRNGVYNGHPQTVTTGSDGAVKIGYRLGNNTVSQYASYQYQIEEGSTATDYEPYSNICPISGHTEVNVYRTGKNLLNYAEIGSQAASTGIQCDADGNISDSVSGDGRVWSYANANWFATLPAGTYTLSWNVSVASTNTSAGLYIFKSDGARVLALYGAWLTSAGAHNHTFTLEEAADLGIMFKVYTSVLKIQLEAGSTATEWAAYTGQTYPISLGQTVYGGTLNVTTGVLTVDRAMVTFDGSETWRSSGSGGQGFYAVLNAMKQASDYSAIISNSLSSFTNNYDAEYRRSSNGVTGYYDSAAQFPNQNWIYAKVDGATTAAELKTWLAANPLQVVYPLATPTTVQLTPTEVTTLLGQNNIWSDAGDTEVTYRADTTLYIQQLTKSDDDFTADASIASGKFFMVGNRLFISTTAISAGESIVIGTNCTEVSLADALNQLNA